MTNWLKRIGLPLLLGGLIVAPAYFLERLYSQEMTLSTVIPWALIEETLKYLAVLVVYLAYRRKIEFYEIVSVGLGFALVENTLFLRQAIIESGALWSQTVVLNVIFRTIGATLVHLTTVGLIGILLWVPQKIQKWSAWLLLLLFPLGVLIHSWWNWTLVANTDSDGFVILFRFFIVWLMFWGLLTLRQSVKYVKQQEGWKIKSLIWKITKFSFKYFGLIFVALMLIYGVTEIVPEYGPLQISEMRNNLEQSKTMLASWSSGDAAADKTNKDDIDQVVEIYKLIESHLSSIVDAVENGQNPKEEDVKFWDDDYAQLIEKQEALAKKINLNVARANLRGQQETKLSWLQDRGQRLPVYEARREILLGYFDQLIKLDQRIIEIRENDNLAEVDKLEQQSDVLLQKIKALADELNNSQ